jgi:hypothetical protein
MAKKQGKKSKKMVKIGKGMKIKRGEEKKLEEKPGGSNVGEYKSVKKSEFAGPAGGAPKGSYPINTLKRARAALAYARNAPNPEGIKRAVYKKYPELKKRKEEREGKSDAKKKSSNKKSKKMMS